MKDLKKLGLGPESPAGAAEEGASGSAGEGEEGTSGSASTAALEEVDPVESGDVGMHDEDMRGAGIQYGASSAEDGGAGEDSQMIYRVRLFYDRVAPDFNVVPGLRQHTRNVPPAVSNLIGSRSAGHTSKKLSARASSNSPANYDPAYAEDRTSAGLPGDGRFAYY